MKVYFLSGLGADKSVFQFLDLSWCTPVFIDWIPPLKNETLPAYALRLRNQFIPGEAVVVGLSFGGMLATEIAKADPAARIILLSSAKSRFEIPSYYRSGKVLPLHSVIPAAVQQWFMLRIRGLMGINSPEAVQVYQNLIRNSNTAFNSWAVQAILQWKNTIVPSNIRHVHGTRDLILPYKLVKPDITVQGGGHLMLMEQAAEISAILRQEVQGYIVTASAGQSSSASPVVHHYPA